MPSGRKGMARFLSSKVTNPIIAKTAGKLAENIDRDSFIEQLKEAWSPLVKKNANIEEEVIKARKRIEEAGPFSAAFKKLGLTDLELQDMLQSIMDSKPEQVIIETPKIGRNEPCPCGSGKKYKKCCGS